MKVTRSLYFWVLVGIVGGVGLGICCPEFAVSLKFLGDSFINLVKMLIAPIIFCTVVTGLAAHQDAKAVGRTGLKALLYFEVISTLALAIGLIVANTLRPGHGFHASIQTLDSSAVSEFVTRAHNSSVMDFLMHLIPHTFLDSFTGQGDLIQVLILAVLFGLALGRLGARGQMVFQFVEEAGHVFFGMVRMIMRLAPLGAAGAMAFTVGKFGLVALAPLCKLMLGFYGACILFIILVLGLVGKIVGFNVFRLVRYLRDEILIVLGTSSSESVLAPIMEKLERLGCQKQIVGLVIPSGYSMNLDGTNIYLTMATLFVAQALDIDLSIGQQLSILGVAMLTSKGASGVTGAGFVTLAATLSIVPDVPVAGLALILGVDRFMSEARALTNMIGNTVATLAIAKWEKALDLERLKKELAA